MGLNKWQVYELLKGNSNYSCKELQDTDKQEIIEGVEEYVYMTTQKGV